jgi:hypothetical protein
MKIEEFIREALLSVVRGVKAAQSDPAHGEMIGRKPNYLAEGTGGTYDDQSNVVSFVQFDLATTVDTSKGGEGAITILSAKIGGEAKVQTSAESRIKFMVPIGIPMPESQRTRIEKKDRETTEAIRRGTVNY